MIFVEFSVKMTKFKIKLPLLTKSDQILTKNFLVKPLKPKIISVTAPPYDGYSMTIKWSHDQPENSTIIYKYKLEYRLKSDNLLPWQTTQEIYDYEFKLNAILVPFHQYEFRVKAYPVMIKGRIVKMAYIPDTAKFSK